MKRYVYRKAQASIEALDLVGLVPTLRCFMRANVASTALVFVDVPNGLSSRPGCVIASPSYADVTDQNYVHHWIRDAAIVAMELAAAPRLDDNGVDRALCDYVAFSKTCQDNAPDGGFFLACYHVDGTPRSEWSEQKDGPALQCLSFIAAWDFLDDEARSTAKEVSQKNLDSILAAWDEDGDVRGPWEDLIGESFFALAAQIRFLDAVSGVDDLTVADRGRLGDALAGLKDKLDRHWDDGEKSYRSIPGGRPSPGSVLDTSVYDPNSDVVMAAVYGSVEATDPRLLSTAAKLRATFDTGGPRAYRINADDRRLRGIGPMIGRYPSDDYDGDIGDGPNTGHPWAICTANFAQLYYGVAEAFRSGNGVAFDDLTGAFFEQLDLHEPTVNDAAQADAVATALVAAGDGMLRAVIFHSNHYRLSEQFDNESGVEKSVEDLSWSYAAYLSAVRARPT